MLSTVLRLIGGVIAVVSLLHLTLGPGAEVLLGSGISELSRNDPTLDSQNRFYGVAFLLYGAILYHCASDIGRYRQILAITIGIFFAAGLARVVSIVITGWPAWPVLALLVVELVGPPLLYVWIRNESSRA